METEFLKNEEKKFFGWSSDFIFQIGWEQLLIWEDYFAPLFSSSSRVFFLPTNWKARAASGRCLSLPAASASATSAMRLRIATSPVTACLRLAALCFSSSAADCFDQRI